MPNIQSSPVRLVADIGGTNARFAMFVDSDATLINQRSLPCEQYSGPVEAIEAYLQEISGPRPREIAMAVATAVICDRVKLTNNHWDFSIIESRQALGVDRLVMLNDFTALAMSLPYLTQSQLRQVGGGQSVANTAIGVIGPGTGLGVSGLLPSKHGWVPIEGEGPHASFSPGNEREVEILRIVWREFPHVSAERLISGIGMDPLYRAIAEMSGKPGPAPDPATITARALDGSDLICRDVMNTFCAMFGTAAANLAVTLGARGGIYIGGGIIPRLGEFFDRSPFRERFEAKGRFSDYLKAIPTKIILAEYPALTGAAQALLRN